MWLQSAISNTPLFKDRSDAGKKLAIALEHFSGNREAIIMALPRGGVPVAYEISQKLHLPMDIFPVRKLGTPGYEELAMGALALDGQYYINKDITASLGVSPKTIESVINKESMELSRRNQLYRHGRPLPVTRGKTVIIIDDGIATGATMRVAIDTLRHAGAKYIVIAVPVGSEDACLTLGQHADELICLEKPPSFSSVGEWYQTFDQVTDEEVISIAKQMASQSL